MGEQVMLKWALKYASLGWQVFPCNTDKTPLTLNGFKTATTHQEQITEWWTKWPAASIGVACGSASGIWVLDIDMPDGPDSLSSVVGDNGMPVTLKQITGGGGTQYFWKWDGAEIRNSSSRIAKQIDVRGEGGYVILPPSSHPSGNRYAWDGKWMAPVAAPEWMVALATKEKEVAPSNRPTAPRGANTRYGEAALVGQLKDLSNATEGTRNDTLNTAAYALGRLVGGNELDLSYVESSLLDIAVKIGLNAKEAQKTIASGIKAGMKDPKKVTDDDRRYYLEPAELMSKKAGVSKNEHHEHNKAVNEQSMSNPSSFNEQNEQGVAESSRQSAYSLATLIKDWVINSGGSFTNDQIDREFCLKTRTEKNNRSQCLYILQKQNLIKKDISLKGKWHVVDSKIDWIDLDAVNEEYFKINLPFGLHEKLAIGRRGIIIVAGSSNAGKTTIILDTLKRNMEQPYDMVYLFSEAGEDEYKMRVRRTGVDMDEWKGRVKAAERSRDFNDVVANHNRNGLTAIDYLEEIDGEYYKIPSAIRSIYDALGTGVAMIAIQKKSDSEYARGGEATTEKCRLYMAVDYLCTLEHAIVCAVKLKKVKVSLDENMNNKELHFKIEHGSQITPLTDWMDASKVNRTQCILEYQGNACTNKDAVYTFMTIEGKEVGLNQRDYDAWKSRYTTFDLDEELERQSRFSRSKPWLHKKNWFHALGGWLDKCKENR